jgi:hypothetical protein
MTGVVRKSTGCWLLTLRSDLGRDAAREYWRGPHARCVAQVPGLEEYRQLHFAERDHGFWPAPAGTGSAIPHDWRLDGMPEVAYTSAWPQPNSLAAAVRFVFRDECNAFDRVLANLSGPWGGRWFSVSDARASARACVLLRRRPGVRQRAFRTFVHETLGGALAGVDGIAELRTHVFLPYSRLLWPTPGVAHDKPPHRRYHASVVLGAADRAALEDIIRSPEVTATRRAQAEHCVALHAYYVEETVSVVSGGRSRLGGETLA